MEQNRYKYNMKYFLPFFIVLFSVKTSAQELKSPSEFLGYELGTQFTRYHEIVNYYEYLAKAAPEKMRLSQYGQTNERRPLLLAYVSSAANMGNLENIRKEHLESTIGKGNPNKAIVWLSYNVHGNESAGTEASMQTIYDLLTTKSNYLENTVVIIDPCINPDGRDRYANWYNQYKNTPYNVDPNSREHHEDWWNGRSNHYMFDLNRDWAWLTQVESRQRLKMFNLWLPHVHVDFHEQGVNNPYYFAPAAEPFHEVITDFQRDFQGTIGKNHAKYFDANGWFYFTKEVFDLLYPSYGDTYPTYNGGIGMTYEQGGSGRAGLGIITAIGDTLTLKDRIAHHHTTGLSTVEVSSNNALKLNEEFKKFHNTKNREQKSYVMTGDADKIDALTQLLDQHEIKYGAANTNTVKGFDYASGKTGTFKATDKSLVVSTDQIKGVLAKVLLEPSAKLTDSLTYDITAWSLPYAYGLDAVATDVLVPSKTYEKEVPASLNLDPNAYAFLTDWNSMQDARFLAELLSEKIRVRFSKTPFNLNGKKFERGSLIITAGDNRHNTSFLSSIKAAAIKHGKSLMPSTTGFVDNGKDFGSYSVNMIKRPKVALLGGEPTHTLQFGELWHFFEQQLHYPITIIDSDYFKRVDLSKYDVLILPEGSYSGFFNELQLDVVKGWVGNGGKLIAMGGAIQEITGKQGFHLKKKVREKDSTELNPQTFDLTEREDIKNTIPGAIFKIKVDVTHPLAFGYGDTYFTLKLGDDAYEYLEKGTVAYLEEGKNVSVSGFAGSEARKKIDKTLIFGVEAFGNGQIIYMVDNPLFRGFWENGKLFFANALFMVQ